MSFLLDGKEIDLETLTIDQKGIADYLSSLKVKEQSLSLELQNNTILLNYYTDILRDSLKEKVQEEAKETEVTKN